MNFVGCPVTETITSELLPNQFNKKVLQCFFVCETRLQKGGVPAAPSGTATYPRLPWLDGRCVQGPGTYSPRHG